MAVKNKMGQSQRSWRFDDLKQIHNNLKAYPTAQHAIHDKNLITSTVTEKLNLDHQYAGLFFTITRTKCILELRT